MCNHFFFAICKMRQKQRQKKESIFNRRNSLSFQNIFDNSWLKMIHREVIHVKNITIFFIGPLVSLCTRTWQRFHRIMSFVQSASQPAKEIVVVVVVFNALIGFVDTETFWFLPFNESWSPKKTVKETHKEETKLKLCPTIFCVFFFMCLRFQFSYLLFYRRTEQKEETKKKWKKVEKLKWSTSKLLELFVSFFSIRLIFFYWIRLFSFFRYDFISNQGIFIVLSVCVCFLQTRHKQKPSTNLL